MSWAAVAGAAVSVGGSMLSKGMSGGGSSGSTTSTASNEPWAPVQPYLLGNQRRQLKAGVTPTYGPSTQVWQGGTGGGENGGSQGGQYVTQQGEMTNPESDYEMVGSPGIFDSAQKLWQQGGWTPAMQAFTDKQGGLLAAQQTQLAGRVNLPNAANALGANIEAGAYDPRITAAKNVTAYGVNPQTARMSQGPLDPTQALQGLLSGQVQNPYIDQQVNALTQKLTQNTTENVLPGIRNAAQAAGQYGGSRQGIAEGLAASRLNQDIASAALPIYSSAFENAQQRQYGAATGLNQQATDVVQNNANRFMNADQFNSNLQLQNNQQAMAAQQQALNSRMTGLSAYAAANAAQDQTTAQQLQNLQQQQGLLSAGNNYDWQNLAKYQNVIYPAAGMGGTQQQSQPYYTNPMAGALGAGMAGYSLFGGQNGLLGGAQQQTANPYMAATMTGGAGGNSVYDLGNFQF